LIRKKYIIPFLALLCVIALLIIGPIPQDQSYHNFMDQRKLLNVPNFLNVVTNLPFLLVGLIGVNTSKYIKNKELKRIIFTLFIGFVLLAIGSSYYHLWPNNNRLVYDRIPMVIIFMSFFSYVIYNNINQKTAYNAFIALNIVGIMTVIYWAITESTGNGDLRWYGMVQFFPIVAIPLILVLYKSSFNLWKEIVPIFIFFGLAKITEKFDKETYHLLSNTISGHSLKHLLMAAAGYEILVMIRNRLNAA